LTREETAEPAEANGANEGTGSAVDVSDGVERFIADLASSGGQGLREALPEAQVVETRTGQ
jgi:hypothetical protein